MFTNVQYYLINVNFELELLKSQLEGKLIYFRYNKQQCIVFGGLGLYFISILNI